MSSDEKTCQMKVVLRGSKPPIWRRLWVSPSSSLFDLHKIIQTAMGWVGGHLHQFTIDGQEYSIPSDDDWEPVMDERRVRIAEISPVEGRKFFYLYDFGDSWEHEIIIEKTLPAVPNVQYPCCVKGKRACPPEDVGGVWGFAEFLEAMNDPEHEEHESYLEWFGGEFDPEAFDLQETNLALRHIDQKEWWEDI